MTTSHRICPASHHRCLRNPECRLDCMAEPHITMIEKPSEWLGDLINTFVWWSGTIALIALIMVAAGVAFGFF